MSPGVLRKPELAEVEWITLPRQEADDSILDQIRALTWVTSESLVLPSQVVLCSGEEFETVRFCELSLKCT